VCARRYSAAEVDAAVEALEAPGRLAHAEEVVTHAAPGLQRVLDEALAQGGWFGEAHGAEVARVAAVADGDERQRAMGSLVAEETRLGMLVGVAVGFELARELQGSGGIGNPPAPPTTPPTTPTSPPEENPRTEEET
jgi:hypothetical protein